MNNLSDYFLIGDLHTAALVSNKGSIDWLCLPRFDSPSLFAKMLDKRSGFFSLDMPGFSVMTEYISDTAIVKFNFKKGNDEFIVKDFMLPQPIAVCGHHYLIRKFEGLSQTVTVKAIFNPKPNYARSKCRFYYDGLKSVLTAEINKGRLSLYLPKGTKIKETEKGFELIFKLESREIKQIELEYVSARGKLSPKKSVRFEKGTQDFWREWVSKGRFFNFCRRKLVRSAITLKLMQYYPTGAIVAAPTTSLPEEIGGVRNWDYRYTWIRDATFTLYAFYILNFTEEAISFFKYIQKVTRQCAKENFDVSLMYTIEGEPVPSEKNLKHFSGYKNSKPVRVGNDAAKQFQLDVYGSLLDAYYFVSKKDIKAGTLNKKNILRLAEKIEKLWLKPDSGIWEVRGGPKHFIYSKVMAWVGINRSIRMSKDLKIRLGKLVEWKKLEKEIKDWIWAYGFNEKRNSFKQYPESDNMDATNFLFVLLQFLDKHDSLTEKIIRNTARELLQKKVFVYRYKNQDGLPGKEGAFLLCSFWLISALAILEKVEESLKLFKEIEKFIAKNNLLSEEINPQTGEYLGNYPQAFSHLGYIMSAYYLDKYARRHKIKLN